jgi:hypothetical protein
MKNIIAKFLEFVRKINFHWFVAFGAFGFICYLRLFGFWGPAVALAVLLALRRQIGKLDIKVPAPK